MLWERIKNLTRYEALHRRDFNRRSSNEVESELNEQLIGYPRNHTYRVHESKPIPCFRLYERYRTIESIFPKPMGSFLDVGSCKGFYVLSAVGGQSELGCEKAVGIDVHAPYVDLCNRLKEYLTVPKASFHHASLDEVSRDPESYGGPFQTVLMLSCYHYFFWGSDLCASAYHSHHEILARLSKLCTGTLLLSGRLECSRLPSRVQKRVKSSKYRKMYNTEELLKSAAAFFDVQIGGYLGRSPVFVMKK
jgi:hypothetical protein